MFCRNCGKPSEAPLCPECAAAEQAPMTQPGVAPEVAPADAPAAVPAETPAAVPAEEYLVMNLGEEQNAEENAPAKKKKSKKGLWISLIAVVAVLSLLLGLFWNTIMGWLRYQTSDPEEWYQEVEMESAKAATGGIAKLYGMLIKGDGLPLGDFNTADTKVELQINPTLLDAVTALVPNPDQLPVDLNKLQNLSVSTKFTATEDMLHLTASLSGELDLHIYVDLPNSKVYLQLPQAQEQALVIDTKQMLGLDLSGGLEGLLNGFALGYYGTGPAPAVSDDIYFEDNYGTAETPPLAFRSNILDMITGVLNNRAFKDAMPSEEEFQGMLDRITGAAITALSENAQKDRREVTAGNSSETQNVLTTVMDEAAARQALKAVITTAKDDATVKKILDAVSAYLTENGMEMDLHSMVSMALPALITELDQPANIPGSITLETYLNDKDEIVGRAVTVSGFDDESVRLSYNVVSGEAFIVQMPELTVTGTIEEQDGVTTVTFDLPMDANNAIKMMIKCSDTMFSIRVTPPADLIKQVVDAEAVPEALLSELALEIGVESTGSNNAKLWVSALAGETPMVTLSLSETLSKETPALPGNTVDVTDLRSIVSWVMSVDRSSLVQALTNLGLKEEFADDLISEIVYNATYNLV